MAAARILARLVEEKRYPELFDRIENRGLLIQQADSLGAFQAAGGGLETHVLPAVIQLGDWERFLHYSLLALNLRHLAESLADPVILRALARGGRLGLAADVVQRVADPLARAAARAHLADALREPDPDAFRGQVAELRRELDALAAGVPDAEEQPAARLTGIAACAGSEFSALDWAGWTARLPPGDASAVRAAVAESWLACRSPRDEGFWGALAAVADPGKLLERAPRKLGARPGLEIEETLERLASLFPADPERAFRAGLAFLDARVEWDADGALAAWERWQQRVPSRWSVSLVEEGRHLFGLLTPEACSRLLAAVSDPEAVLALRLLQPQECREPGWSERILADIDRLPPSADTLHWSLRYLDARPGRPESELRAQASTLLAAVADRRYNIPPPDLRLCLDLVARHSAAPLPEVLADLTGSPAVAAEVLPAIAAAAETEGLLLALLAQAELHVARLAENEAQAFQLRGRLIQNALRRLCFLTRDLAPLQNAASRLLPEEEDALRASLALDLAEVRETGLARLAQAGIHHPRLAFLTDLRIAPPSPEALSAGRLYQAVASVEAVAAELQGLRALLQPPVDLAARLRTDLAPLRAPDLQALFLLRLADHALAFEATHLERFRDRTAPLEIVRSGLTLDSDESLAALTPALARLGSTVSWKRARAEFEEAFWNLAGLTGLSRPARLDAFEELLASVEPAFFELDTGASPRHRRQGAAEALAFLARLPARMEDGPPREALRRQWPEILPRLLAAAERLPGDRPAVLSRGLAEGLSCLSSTVFPPAEAAVLDLCQADPETRRAAAGLLLAGEGGEEVQVTGLIYLLLAAAPDLVAPLLRKLPEGSRDAVAVRLIRLGWVTREAAEPVVAAVADPGAQARATLWACRWAADASDRLWSALTRAVQEEPPDPSSPSNDPLVRWLWTLDPDKARPALAAAAVTALRSGGRTQGERALRLWLHAHLQPRPDRGETAGLDLAETAAEAVEKARFLGGVPV